MIKKLILLIIILVLHSLNAQDNAQLQRNIQNIDEKIKILKNQISSLQDEISKINNQIDSLKIVKERLKVKNFSPRVIKAKIMYNSKLKESTDLSARTLLTIPKGSTALVYEYKNYSWKVEYNNRIGYISSVNLVESKELEELKNYCTNLEKDNKRSETLEKKKRNSVIYEIEKSPYWVKSFSANLREKPTENSKIMQKLEQGDKLFLQTKDGNWIQVKIRNRNIPENIEIENIPSLYTIGWIHQSLISDTEVDRLSDWEKEEHIESQKKISERKNYIKNHPEIKESFKNAILKGQIILGMTKEMVIASWGEPRDINRTVTQNIVREQWIYGMASIKRTYLYFDNGILSSWQD